MNPPNIETFKLYKKKLEAYSDKNDIRSIQNIIRDFSSFKAQREVERQQDELAIKDLEERLFLMKKELMEKQKSIDEEIELDNTVLAQAEIVQTEVQKRLNYIQKKRAEQQKIAEDVKDMNKLIDSIPEQSVSEPTPPKEVRIPAPEMKILENPSKKDNLDLSGLKAKLLAAQSVDKGE